MTEKSQIKRRFITAILAVFVVTALPAVHAQAQTTPPFREIMSFSIIPTETLMKLIIAVIKPFKLDDVDPPEACNRFPAEVIIGVMNDSNTSTFDGPFYTASVTHFNVTPYPLQIETLGENEGLKAILQLDYGHGYVVAIRVPRNVAAACEITASAQLYGSDGVPAGSPLRLTHSPTGVATR